MMRFKEIEKKKEDPKFKKMWNKSHEEASVLFYWIEIHISLGGKVMNIIKTLKDDYGNIATIEKMQTIPYRGAPIKTPLFRLSLMAEYDNNFLYHVSCYETLEETLAELLKCSAGTFKEIERKEG